MKPNQNTQVRHNKQVHDAVASSYERKHTEIFNPTEQARIVRVLEDAISQIATVVEDPLVLDYGAGTGNLTGHLLMLGTRVIAADVSQKSLAALRKKYSAANRLESVELNGVDLSMFKDNSLDMVATYSVLHHVPDYLGVVREFVRVVKPGGIIYIDHESAPQVWQEDGGNYKKYMTEYECAYGRSFCERLVRKFRNLLSYSAWQGLVNWKLFGLRVEGDIHVTKGDHIEWDLIETAFCDRCEVVMRQDYLVCREVSPRAPVHRQYDGICSDMRVVIAKKRH
jgi:ubiquinone/menaquinone biosynthesis C-methylase UbiE